VPLRLLALEHAGGEAVAHEPPQHVVLKGVGIVLVGAAEHVMRHVGGEPSDDEARAENAAVIEDVAILIGGALPRDDACEWRRPGVWPPPLWGGKETGGGGG